MSEHLPRTSQALFHLRAQERYGFGSHLGDRLAVGVPGTAVGEVPFDPSRHEVEAINSASAMELVTGMPHVTQVVPYRPVTMNIVLHQEPADRQVRAPWMQPVADAKQALARSLHAAVRNSTQPSDKSRLYIAGEQVSGTREGVVVDDGEGPEATAQAIADICKEGLTFVISDFKNLPLDMVGDANFARTIGVKVNHPLELALPANTGSISMGGLDEVNTNSRRELKRANKELRRLNDGIEAGLGTAGLTVAKVVYEPEATEGFDVGVTDADIAAAITLLDR